MEDLEEQAQKSDSIGISENRVINANEHEATIRDAICPICTNIIWNPVCCSRCNTNYCKGCIDASLSSQRTKGIKPLCTNRCLYSEAVNPLLANRLADLKISCINKDQGCNVSTPYDNIEKHEMQCHIVGDNCEFCGERYLSKYLQAHKKICEEAIVPVDCCFKPIKRKNLSEHDQLNCYKLLLSEARTRILVMELEATDLTLKLDQALVDKENLISQLYPYQEKHKAPVGVMMSKIEEKKQNQIVIANRNNGLSMNMIREFDCKFSPPKNGIAPVCLRLHTLQPWDLKTRGYDKFDCAYCKKNYRGISWHCKPCRYDRCSNCRLIPNKRDHCIWGHKMTEFSPSLKEPSDFYCQKCYIFSIKDSRLRCEECKFVMCFKCNDVS
jgi:hypothetical protein